MTVTRSIRRLALAASAVAVLAGVTAARVSAETTLRFISWQVEDKAFGPWWKAAIAEFEKSHPGVKIEFTNVPRDSYADQMTTLFASGSPPDIVHLASFEFQSFADNGWLEDLDPWIKKSGLDLKGWAGQKVCHFDDHDYCIMLLYFGYVMAYNQKMLDAAGVKVPTNWDEYLAAAKKLTVDKSKNGLTDQYGVGISTAAGGGQYLSELLSYVLDTGAYWTNAEGQPTLDTPQMIEALGRWKMLIKDRLTPVDMPAGAVRQAFIEGKIATRIDGPWIWGLMQSAAPAIRSQLKLAAPPFHPPGGGSSNVITMPSELDRGAQAARLGLHHGGDLEGVAGEVRHRGGPALATPGRRAGRHRAEGAGVRAHDEDDERGGCCRRRPRAHGL